MPNRILKESICTSDSVDGLSWFEEVFFYRLIVNCDDYGRMDARPSVLKARLFPLKERITSKDCSVALQKLLDAGVARTYVCEGKPYLYFVNWESHQSIRAKKSKYPDPSICEHMNASEIICNQMNANVPVIQSNPIRYPIRIRESEPGRYRRQTHTPKRKALLFFSHAELSLFFCPAAWYNKMYFCRQASLSEAPPYRN